MSRQTDELERTNPNNRSQQKADSLFSQDKPYDDVGSKALSDQENAVLANTAKDLGSLEGDGSSGWQNNTNPDGGNHLSQASWGKRAFGKLRVFTKKPIGILSLVGGGGILGIAASLMFLMPNQLKMAVENAMSAAGAIPEYAMQQRGEYIATRYFASRILALSDTDFDQKMIFCSNGSITCSLASTKFAESFDKKYGLTVKPTVSGSSITVKPQGRSGLGGRAISWDIEYSRTGSFDGKLRTITRSIDNNNDMLKYIKHESKRAHSKNRALRLIAKRTLMKRYGVTHFRAFEKQRNAVKLSTSKLKAKVAVNTVGKILPKMPAYFACLQGKQAIDCQQTLRAATDSINKQISKLDEQIKNEPDAAKREKLISRKTGLGELSKGITSPNLEGKTGKLVAKNLISKAAGPLAIAGVLDLVFEVIGGIDDGVIEQVSYDIMSQGYLGLAYGDEIGLVTNVDQATVEGTDIETLGLLTQMVDGMGSSPLYQMRTGQFTYDSSKSYSSECDTETGRKIINLPKGELVCPEEKMVKSYTGFKNDSRWAPLAFVAGIWNSSVGLVFDLVGGVLGAIVGPAFSLIGQTLSIIPGISNLKEYSMEVLGKAMEWMINSLFGIPDIGPEGSGTTNYVATDGAITKTLNDTMENGVDLSNGDVLGAGGRVLSNSEKLAINNVMLGEEREEFNTKPVLAKLFDGNLRGSAINKLALVMPSNVSGLLGFGPKLLGNMTSILSTNTFAASGSYNPHGFALYGYGTSDTSIFEENPLKYDTTFCAESAKKREDSYTIRNGDALPSYGETDPCALEKVVVGFMLDEAGITTDVNSIKEADSEQMNVSSNTGSNETPETETSTGDLIDGASWPVEKRFWDNRKGQFLSAHGTSSGTFTTPGRNGYAIDLGANSVFTGERPPVYSMFAGRVSRFLCGTTSSVIISSTINGKSLQVAYAHMVNGNLKGGETVSAGQKIGTVGALGCKVNGAHLHMDMSYDGRAVCPQDVFKDMGDNKPLDFERYTKQIRTGCGVR